MWLFYGSIHSILVYAYDMLLSVTKCPLSIYLVQQTPSKQHMFITAMAYIKIACQDVHLLDTQTHICIPSWCFFLSVIEDWGLTSWDQHFQLGQQIAGHTLDLWLWKCFKKWYTLADVVQLKGSFHACILLGYSRSMLPHIIAVCSTTNCYSSLVDLCSKTLTVCWQ